MYLNTRARDLNMWYTYQIVSLCTFLLHKALKFFYQKNWLARNGLARDWLPKFATGLYMIFCQNGSPMRGSFWQKNSFITHILFVLQPIIIFSPVANFGNQSIVARIWIPAKKRLYKTTSYLVLLYSAQLQILVISL